MRYFTHEVLYIYLNIIIFFWIIYMNNYRNKLYIVLSLYEVIINKYKYIILNNIINIFGIYIKNGKSYYNWMGWYSY